MEYSNPLARATSAGNLCKYFLTTDLLNLAIGITPETLSQSFYREKIKMQTKKSLCTKKL